MINERLRSVGRSDEVSGVRELWNHLKVLFFRTRLWHREISSSTNDGRVTRSLMKSSQEALQLALQRAVVFFVLLFNKLVQISTWKMAKSFREEFKDFLFINWQISTVEPFLSYLSVTQNRKERRDKINDECDAMNFSSSSFVRCWCASGHRSFLTESDLMSFKRWFVSRNGDHLLSARTNQRRLVNQYPSFEFIRVNIGSRWDHLSNHRQIAQPLTRKSVDVMFFHHRWATKRRFTFTFRMEFKSTNRSEVDEEMRNEKRILFWYPPSVMSITFVKQTQVI